MGSQIFNNLENVSQSIACNFGAWQELWNTRSRMCSITACGWAFIRTARSPNETRQASFTLHTQAQMAAVSTEFTTKETAWRLQETFWLCFSVLSRLGECGIFRNNSWRFLLRRIRCGRLWGGVIRRTIPWLSFLISNAKHYSH